MWHGLGRDDFLTCEATVGMREAVGLAGLVADGYLVFHAPEDDELAESSYYVVGAQDLLSDRVELLGNATVRELLRSSYEPAVVLDTDDGWMRSPAMESVRDVVVLGRDGVVSTVVPAREVRGGGGPEAAEHHLHLAAEGMASSPPLASLAPAAPEAAEAEAAALEVKFPDAVQPRQVVPVLIVLVSGPGAEGSAPLTVREGDVIELMVSPVSGFTLVDKPAKKMTVVLDGETLPVKFDLLADDAAGGKGEAKVYAFRDDVCVASITVSARISEAPRDPAAASSTELVVPQPAVKALADLDLFVFQESNRGGVSLRYRLASADGRVASDFGPHPIDTEPGGYVRRIFTEIQELRETGGKWAEATRQRLERIGSGLYEALVPPDVQEILWNTERVRSLVVQSEEPWIPWELLRMTLTRDGHTEARGYLCDLYEMSRWTPGLAPKTELRATRIGVVAPRDSGLASAEPEVDMLEGLAASGPEVNRIKAVYQSVIEAFIAPRYDVLHFIGHGQSGGDDASRASFSLSGQWRLRPTDISGETRNLGQLSPIVFMNACQLAQASMGLNGVGGWAAALTRAGAGAFVGTHWDVTDDLAHVFSATFYSELVGSSTVAGAVRAARRAVRDRSAGDPTWLAYSVHASPGATCTFAAPVG